MSPTERTARSMRPIRSPSSEAKPSGRSPGSATCSRVSSKTTTGRPLGSAARRRQRSSRMHDPAPSALPGAAPSNRRTGDVPYKVGAWSGHHRSTSSDGDRLCDVPAGAPPEATEDGVRFYAGAVSDAYLRRTNIQRGLTVVIWRGRHVAEPTELNDEETHGYWRDLLIVGRTLEDVLRPVKTNLPSMRGDPVLSEPNIATT
jgi:hypothetical protein